MKKTATYPDLAGRTAIVTGAAQGIGEAVSLRLAREGCAVALVDINGARLETLLRKIESEGGRALAIKCDVSLKKDVDAAVALVADEWKGPDILVNNAALTPRVPFEELTLEEWNNVLGINLTGSFLFSQAVMPRMRAKGWGRIIMMSSDAGEAGAQIAGAHYAVSKAGQINLMRCLAPRLAPEGVTVNAVAPSSIETPVLLSLEPELIAGLRKSIPVRRTGKPEEVAALVAFLCSEEASFITGATMDINGGTLIR